MKPKLIILPGWSGTQRWWEHQCQYLAEIADPEVKVMIDQDTIDKMADNVLETDADHFILCGHSLGGWVAQQVAIKAPHRVSKLILISTWTGESTPQNRELYKQALIHIENDETKTLFEEVRPLCIHPEHKTDKKLITLMRLAQEEFPKQGLINQTNAELNSAPTTTALCNIQCPTLILYGRQDSIFSLSQQEILVKNIPNAKFVIVENAGHMLSLEQPEATTALMRLWIEL